MYNASFSDDVNQFQIRSVQSSLSDENKMKGLSYITVVFIDGSITQFTQFRLMVSITERLLTVTVKEIGAVTFSSKQIRGKVYRIKVLSYVQILFGDVY